MHGTPLAAPPPGGGGGGGGGIVALAIETQSRTGTRMAAGSATPAAVIAARKQQLDVSQHECRVRSRSRLQMRLWDCSFTWHHAQSQR